LIFSVLTNKLTQYNTVKYKTQNIIYGKYNVSAIECHVQGVYYNKETPSPTCQSGYSGAETRRILPQIVSEGDRYLSWLAGLVFLCFTRFLVHGIPVPKHVGVDTCHESYFVVFILLSAYLFNILKTKQSPLYKESVRTAL
jgi:hypothetical protein